jgi:copper oxidase (laccase) domain-containing protein
MRVKQVHGNAVRVLRRGEVPENAAGMRPDGDAVASNHPGLVLAVMVADCVPILLVDRRHGAAAAVHAGWRGTCARVAPAAIDVMRREFGTQPGDLIAALGPSVGPDDYEVGDNLIARFADAGHPAADIDRWFIRSKMSAPGSPPPRPAGRYGATAPELASRAKAGPLSAFAATRPLRRDLADARSASGGGPAPGKLHLDLWRANTDQLIAAGMTADRVFSCGLSTVAHPDVFASYRVMGERAGRMAGLVVVPPPA